MKVINKEVCPHCGQTINERQIVLFTGMVQALWKVLRWCESHQQTRFSRKEIKGLFENENQVARFGDWILFSDILKRDGSKGHYQINIGKAKDFFTNRLTIPTILWKDPITGNLRSEEWKAIRDIPNLTEFLDQNYDYITRYAKQPVSAQQLLF